ncbi:hypothetical protein NH340_JMT08570 [Sarcoptes scabiei]|nr:hypothetical protein NH340_JMT08570 [Sarcoptes scabiei]
MPYVTREQANKIKQTSKGSKAIDIETDEEGRKLRNLPSAVDPRLVSKVVSKASSKSSSPSSSQASSFVSSSSASKSSKSKSSAKSTATSVQKSENKSTSKSSKSCKKSIVKSKSSKSSLLKVEEPYESPHASLSFDEKKLKYTIELLKSNLTRMQGMDGAIKVENSKDFHQYRINFKRPLIRKLRNCDAIVFCAHRSDEFKEFPLCCKCFDRQKYRIDPERSEFLRILRVLSRKHPNIIQTWGLFYEESKQRILLVQEYFHHGSLESYLENPQQHPCYTEQRASEIAQQIVKAMDYLGDLGIAHRSITPHYIMIAHRDPIRVKLTGFKSAIIYWNLKRETVQLIPCVSLTKKPKQPEYQAPEVYGDPDSEAFDPIYADIWSLGATIYFVLTRKYPYDFSMENPKLEEEIRSNVKRIKLSKRCRNFLRQTLCTDSEKRIKFDFLSRHHWIMK